MQESIKKPWWQSKTILLALTSVLVFGSNLLSGWLTMQGVTPEQVDAISQAEGPVRDAIENVKSGGNVLSAVGSLFGVAILVIRAWFTNKIIG
jgi:hypothetical protein